MPPKHFPPAPTIEDRSFLEPSAEFKHNAKRAVLSIALFIFVFIIISIGGIYFSWLIVRTGIMLFTKGVHLWLYVAAAGLVFVGLLLAYYLIKFLFNTNKFDRSNMVEIQEADQPDLFAFIYQIADDVGTARPKRIYLVPDVNAFVFYDSTFWSMFLPIEKNLAVGVGLINATQLDEFKFVISHEFGHFSQESMKVGSYVYQANRVIYAQVAENSGVYSFLSGFAELHLITWALAHGVSWVIRGIMQVLIWMYALIQKSYSQLSQQMEFHADAVAVSQTGGMSGVRALLKLEMAASGMQEVSQYLELEKKKVVNIFEFQTYVFTKFRQNVEERIGSNWFEKLDQIQSHSQEPRIRILGLWESHPPTLIRSERMLSYGIAEVKSDESAWVLIKNRHEIEQRMTSIFLGDFKGELIPFEEFQKLDREREINSALPNSFRQYFELRPLPAEWREEATSSALSSPPKEPILQIESARTWRLLKQEEEILKSIAHKTIDIKKFEYKGELFKREDAGQLVSKVSSEREQLEIPLQQFEEAFITYQLQQKRASGEDGDFKQRMESLKDARIRHEKFEKEVQKTMNLFEYLQRIQTDTQALHLNEQMVSALLDCRLHATILLKEFPEILHDHPQAQKALDTLLKMETVFYTNGQFHEHRLKSMHEGLIYMNQFHTLLVQSAEQSLMNACVWVA